MLSREMMLVLIPVAVLISLISDHKWKAKAPAAAATTRAVVS
jgi:hypothetical protein